MRRHLAFLVAILAVASGAGCGQDQSVDPIQIQPECPDLPVRGPLKYASEPAVQLIDDFESGPDDYDLPQVGGRTGYWALGTDGSSGVLIAEVSGKCAARGNYAGHFEGRGFTNWGNNWTAVFVSTGGGSTAVPYDARGYSGISFWAAFGQDNPQAFSVPVGVTTMDNAWNNPSVCGKKCMDYYKTTVPLTRTWQRFVVRFDSMAQEGWGDVITPMKKDQMVGFIIWPRQEFDIWIDDVRFEI
jgi:hypothetical protein